MLDVIDKKINGQDVVGAQEEQEDAKIIDIMETLKASLASNESSSKPKRAARKRPYRKPRRTSQRERSKRRHRSNPGFVVKI